MINKYIKVEQGTYRNQDMSGRIFPILKDYQRFAGEEGGFVTVDCSELDGFEGLDKARINVPALTDLTLTTEGAFQIQRDELKKDTPEVTPAGEETDEQAIERIAARFSILLGCRLCLPPPQSALVVLCRAQVGGEGIEIEGEGAWWDGDGAQLQ